MDQLLGDLRLALRAMAKRPGTSLLVILTLAAGITVNTVVFSLVNGVAFKPKPFANAERLAWTFASGPGERHGGLSVDELERLRRASRTFADIGGESPLGLGLKRPDGTTEQVWSLLVSDNYFDVVGVTPIRGRTFGEADRGQRAAMVSERFWRERLAAGAQEGAGAGASTAAGVSRDATASAARDTDTDTSTAAHTLILNNQTFTIAGVLPTGFRGFGSIYMPDVWVPLSALDLLGLQHLARPDQHVLTIAGRLADGVESAAPVRAELRALTSHVLRQPQPGTVPEGPVPGGPGPEGARAEGQRAEPAAPAGGTAAGSPPPARSLTTVLMRDGHPDGENLRPFALVGLAAVGLVLLLACFNVTALLLARAHERQREMGVRAALGASHARLVRQLLTESLLLAGIAGVAALLVSTWSHELLSAFSLPAPIPIGIDVRPDWRLAAFALGLSAAAGVLPGLAPAFHVRRLDLLRVLRNDERSTGGARQRGQRGLLLAQIAGSTCLLALAVLFLRSFQQVQHLAPGFETSRALVLELNPSEHGYSDARAAAAFYDQVLQRLRALPAVRETAVTIRPPGGVGYVTRLEVSTEAGDCRRDDCPRAAVVRVGRGYFDALRIPIVAGSGFATGQPVSPDDVIVSERVAAQVWPGRSPIGAWLHAGDDRKRYQVRGVAREVNHIPPGEDRSPELYTLLRDDEVAGLSIVVGTRGDPAPVASAAREMLHGLDPDVPIVHLKTMNGHLELARWAPMTLSAFSATCAGVALALATVGLFGLTHRTVGQRLREFGIRSALGASRRQLLTLVLRDGLLIALPGVLLGIGTAAIASRALRATLMQVSTADPASYVLVAMLQVVVALAACALPARRAARVDPLTVLRAE